MAIEWFFEVFGETLRPVSAKELRAMAQAGSVTPSTRVRQGCDGKWVSARRVKGLFEPAGEKSSESPPIPSMSPPAAVSGGHRRSKQWADAIEQAGAGCGATGAPPPVSSGVSETFDPYHKWLGIPPKDQPANHYRLLGVEVFESDPDVIANAADRQCGQSR